MRPQFSHPLAIAMWDFSWLERRWPGAGYEDWDTALGELAERGYDAVRIDAYPHLVSAGPEKAWDLVPVWTQMGWGAQSPITVQVLPALVEFLRAAQRQGVSVALSSWYREDRENVRMRATTPEDHANMWIDVLGHIDDAGLLDTIIYVDLCNEFPLPIWAPFLGAGVGDAPVSRTDPRLIGWMTQSIEAVRSRFPDIDYTYSFCNEFSNWQSQDVSMLDILEPHIWMATADDGRYNTNAGYAFDKFDPASFDRLVTSGRTEYERNQDEYDGLLFAEIDRIADWSRASRLPVYTTECWALVDFKDWPGLEWDWIQDLNARAVAYAAKTGRWVGLATSNFCGPQFVGMWRDIAWHRRLTDLIKASPIDADLVERRAPSVSTTTSRPGR